MPKFGAVGINIHQTSGEALKTMLFLGAGASKFVGMPDTKELVRSLKDQIGREKWDSPAAEYLVRSVVGAHEDEGKDVEELYETIHNMIDAVELYKKIVKHKVGDFHREITYRKMPPDIEPSKEDELVDIEGSKKALEELMVAIRNTLLANLMVKPESVDAVVELYNELRKHVQPNNIVTTNYDNVLETYCEQNTLKLTNGFKASHLGDIRMWNKQWRGRGDGISLIKIHGSITWQEDDDGNVLEIGRPGMRDTRKDVMIAPTLSEKDYSKQIFPDLQDRFELQLKKADLLIVVGFSFRDCEINEIFRRRLTRSDGGTSPTRLLYIGPLDAGDNLKKFVGVKDEPREVRQSSYALWDYSSGDMPYVYAYREKFEGAAKHMRFVLEDLDTACNAPPAD